MERSLSPPATGSRGFQRRSGPVTVTGTEISFDSYRAIVGSVPGRLVILVLSWAYLHHFCAGIRYLLLDLHMGTAKEQARTSATLAMGASLFLTALVALKLFGVF